MQILSDLVGCWALPPSIPRSQKLSGTMSALEIYSVNRKSVSQSGINYDGRQEVPLIPLSFQSRYVIGFKRNVLGNGRGMFVHIQR